MDLPPHRQLRIVLTGGPGAGKTVIGLAAMAQAGVSTLIVATSILAARQWIGELRAKGVTFETYGEPATDDDGIHTFGDHKVAWFKDPDGNTLAVDNGGLPS